ncbi:hypothetical protein J2S74_004597 [Evansella vedderi]|uniref:NADH dehydrogenase subunit 4L n=1 Tax=Evansella vedderi TaxID=38282 RepID=A0ABU0A0Y2_9BACI|nr:hypothetical protein [Evansella vedderi]MDQ0257151.1 hypothetical protein [Evansella vedderi]
MKIFVTLLLVLAIISLVVGVKKKQRNMIIISSLASVGFLVLYMVLFRF